jgi:CRP-like cAMP-binding protein
MHSATVKSVPLFALVPRRERGNVTSWADEVDVPAGTTLARQGEFANEFFVILDGSAKVIRDGVHVATLGAGEFFGELGLLEGPARSASVVALTDMRLLVVAAREFRTMLHVAPGIAAEVRQAAAERRPVDA